MEKISERNETKKKFKGKAYVASFSLSLSFSCLRGNLVLVGLFWRWSKLIYHVQNQGSQLEHGRGVLQKRASTATVKILEKYLYKSSFFGIRLQAMKKQSPKDFNKKNMFLKTSKNSLENTCVRVYFLHKVAGLKSATLLKKRLCHRCFLVNFSKSLRTPFYRTHLGEYF